MNKDAPVSEPTLVNPVPQIWGENIAAEDRLAASEEFGEGRKYS